MTNLPAECRAVQERLVEAIKEPQIRDQLELHVSRCQACQATAASLDAIVHTGRSYGAGPVAPVEFDRILRATEGFEARRRRRWKVAGAAMAATAVAAAAAVALIFWPDTSDRAPLIAAGTLTGTSGLQLERATPGLKGKGIFVGDTIATGAEGDAQLTVLHTQIVARPQTRVRLDAFEAAAQRWSIEQGTALFFVEPERNQRVEVETPHGTVRVVGTVFRVHAGRDDLEVSVLRGSVEVVSGNRTDRVGADSVLSVRRAESRRSERRTIPAAHRSELLNAFGGQPVDASSVDRVEEDHDGPDVPHGRPLDRAGVSASLSRHRCHDAAALLGTRAPTRSEADLWMGVAECFGATGARERALGVYRRLAQSVRGSQTGQLAAYEVGRTARALGRRVEAMRAFEDFLRVYPRGSLAPEARFRVCDLHRSAGRTRRSIRCLQDYRRRHPRDDRVADSYYLEATLHRESGNCASAVNAYSAYLRLAEEHEDEARRWREWCRQRP